MSDLKEIKLRYQANCEKCQRTLQVGWKVLYRAEPKKVVYCKPCGEKINNSQPEKSLPDTKEEATVKRLDDIISVQDYHTNTLEGLGIRIQNMDKLLGEALTKLVELNKLIKALKPPKAK